MKELNGLEALEELKFQVGNITYHTRDLQITSFKVKDSGLFEIIEKELKDGENYKVIYRLEHEKNQQLSQANLKMSKALEIIKKYPMFSLHDDLPQGTYRIYDCELYSHYDLTKEEYDLLKEILQWKN